jgi:hypothetical protein
VAPENSDKKSDDKKSSKKTRPLTSGELRSLAEARAKKEERKARAPAKLVPEREITVEAWARGNANPLVLAFLSEHRNQRTVKHTASKWITLYREWKARPRG